MPHVSVQNEAKMQGPESQLSLGDPFKNLPHIYSDHADTFGFKMHVTETCPSIRTMEVN